MEFDNDTENEVLLHYLEKPPCKMIGFRIKEKRTHGDQFLNTHSSSTRDSLAYNTNVQLGCMNHMFYTTNYASKTTQEEDTKSFQKVCNAIVKRIQRQANERERKSKELLEKIHELNKMEVDIKPDIIE